jgi:hypothetical protein
MSNETTDLEQTFTMADWHRHREAEYQRVQDQKKKKEQRKRGNV